MRALLEDGGLSLLDRQNICTDHAISDLAAPVRRTLAADDAGQPRATA